MLQVFKEVQKAAGNQAVVFLVQYPAVNAEIWKKTLMQYFQRHHNTALQYHIDNDEGEDVNVAVICTGQPTEDVKIKSVRFCQAPQPCGNLHFGKAFFFLEVEFYEKRGRGTIAILWAPNLCIERCLQLNTSQLQGASGLLLGNAAVDRTQPDALLANIATYATCSENVHPIDAILEEMALDLSGVVVIMDIQSAYWGKCRSHTWMSDGNVHVLGGTFINGEFIDLASQKICAPPPCYRVRLTTHQYKLTDHTFDFLTNLQHKSRQRHASGVEQSLSSRPSHDDSQEVSKRELVQRVLTLVYIQCEVLLRQHSRTIKSTEKEPEQEEVCFVCLERSPTMIFRACGHFGVCGVCRRWLCKVQYSKNKSGSMEVAQVKMDKVFKLAVPCPLCRVVSKMQYIHYYTGPQKFIA